MPKSILEETPAQRQLRKNSQPSTTFYKREQPMQRAPPLQQAHQTARRAAPAQPNPQNAAQQRLATRSVEDRSPIYGRPAQATPTPSQAPGTGTKVKPPSSRYIDPSLVSNGWTRWQNYAGIPKTLTTKYEGGSRNDEVIKNANGKDASATKMASEEYGGVSGMDVGFCDNHTRGKCDLSWEECPFRHWGPEPIEQRWMLVKFLKAYLANGRGPYLPPDNPHSKYSGRACHAGGQRDVQTDELQGK
jgi:hypothetical protein